MRDDLWGILNRENRGVIFYIQEINIKINPERRDGKPSWKTNRTYYK